MTAKSSRRTTAPSRRAPAKKAPVFKEPSWNNRLLALISIGFTLTVNIGSVGYVYGSTATRLHVGEQRIEKIESKLDTMTNLRIEMAGVKEQLAAINSVLQRLEKQVGERR